MLPVFRGLLAQVVAPALVLLGAPSSIALSQIIGFFPPSDSISVAGTCTPPSLISQVIDVAGGVDTVDIRPMWDDRMYAGPPFGIQISHCFFAVADSLNTNQYQLCMRGLWPDSRAYSIQLDARELPSAAYLCRLEAGRFVQTRKIVSLK